MSDDYKNESVELDSQQQEALEAMLFGRNVFLTGEAGTGKSAVIHEFKRRCQSRVACLASTGIAARRVGGKTIHSFFGLPPRLIELNTSIQITPELRARLMAADTIIIDEIGMVRSDVFQAIDAMTRQVAPSESRELPFGGKQIIAVGDFLQLSPIVSDFRVDDYLKKHFGGSRCFMAPAWENAKFASAMLRHVHRQKDAETLAAIRATRTCDIFMKRATIMNGDLVMDYLDMLNKRCYLPREPFDPEAISLCATRDTARKINNREFVKLPEGKSSFVAEIERKFDKRLSPVDHVLDIKIGQRVMIVANNSSEGYCNGDTGEVVGASDRDFVVVKLSNGPEVKVCRHTWENVDNVEAIDPDEYHEIDQLVIGSFTQFPLIPAYAITVHRAQGKTIDAITLALGERGFFSAGQLYVALSRCPYLDRIRFDRPIDLRDCRVDREALAFYQRIDPRGEYLGCHVMYR